MRRLIVLFVVLGLSMFATPSGAEECRYVRVDRPDGQPPIEVRVCP